MQQKQEIKTCTKSEHNGERLSYVCYDDECSQKGLICVLCLFEHHKGHASEPLKNIIYQIERDEKGMQNNIRLMAQLDKHKMNIKQTTKSIKNQNMRGLLDLSVDLYFKNVETQSSSNYNQQLQQTLKYNPERINDLILNYKKKYSSYEEDDNKTISNQEKFIVSLITQLQSKEESIKQAIKKGNVDNSLLSQFQLNESYSSKRFQFSNKLIHNNLIFENQKKVKMTGYTDDYNYLALLQPAISPSKIQRVTFRMVNLSCYITVGICIKSKIEGNFQFVQNGLGHGCYQMSYDGYSWSDSDASVNNHYNSWYYNQGDKVTVEYNPKEKLVKFIKNGDSENCFKIAFEINKKQKIHFSVSFNSEPEEVEIIQ